MENSRDRLILGTAIVLLLLGLQILRNPAGWNTTATEQQEWNKRVTTHLQVTDHLVEQNSRAVNLENSQLAPKIKTDEFSATGDKTKQDAFVPLSLDREDRAGFVYRDTNAGEETWSDADLPDDKINSSLEHRRWLYEYDRRQKEQFIRAFIDEAEKNGVEVQIDENFQVQAREALQKHKPLRFPLSEKAYSPGTAQ